MPKLQEHMIEPLPPPLILKIPYTQFIAFCLIFRSNEKCKHLHHTWLLDSLTKLDSYTQT